MNFAHRIFPSEAEAMRPRVACEIMPAGVIAARPGTGEREILSAFAPLRPGVLTPGLTDPNFHDRAAAASALRHALAEVGLRDNQVTVVIPDAAVRVLLLDFDALPSKAAEALPIIRFRLRKLVSFDVENAAVSFQVLPVKTGPIRVMVAVSPAAVLAEYESAIRESGCEPGAVLPSTLAAIASIMTDEPSLVVNRNADTITTAIAWNHDLLLHRTLQLTKKDWLPEENMQHSIEEIQQSVSVAAAYFEDTLNQPPRCLLACGLGGAKELSRMLGHFDIPAREMVSDSRAASDPLMPRGILAGVVGALAN